MKLYWGIFHLKLLTYSFFIPPFYSLPTPRLFSTPSPIPHIPPLLHSDAPQGLHFPLDGPPELYWVLVCPRGRDAGERVSLVQSWHTPQPYQPQVTLLYFF